MGEATDKVQQLGCEMADCLLGQEEGIAIAAITSLLASTIRMHVTNHANPLTNEELKQCLHAWSMATKLANNVFAA